MYENETDLCECGHSTLWAHAVAGCMDCEPCKAPFPPYDDESRYFPQEY